MMFVTLDEKSQTEKKTATLMLIQASDFKDALATLEEGMKGSMVDYEINLIQETNILDVFPFDAEEKKDKPEYES